MSTAFDGFYVMGKYTSVAWFPILAEAEVYARYLNFRGGQHYKVESASRS